MKTKLLLTVIALALAVVPHLHAQVAATATKSGNWEDPTVFRRSNTYGVPTDGVAVNIGWDIKLSTKASQAGVIIGTVPAGGSPALSANPAELGRLEIVTGGNLTTSTLFTVAQNHASNGYDGELVLNGGDFYSASAVNVGAGNLNTKHGAVEIKAGSTWTSGAITIGNNTTDKQTGKFSIHGSGSSVNINGVTTVNLGGTIEFKFDAAGISTATLNGNLALNTGGTFIVDGSDYSGGDKLFTLFEFINVSNVSEAILTAVSDGIAANNLGFKSDYTVALDTSNAKKLQLSITSSIPEPAAYAAALAALAILAIALRRRKS